MIFALAIARSVLNIFMFFFSTRASKIVQHFEKQDKEHKRHNDDVFVLILWIAGVIKGARSRYFRQLQDW